MDFGVARLGGATTSSGVIVGTPNYMSPEQVSGGNVDGRSDVFSAGLILYELVTGEKAFQGDSVVSLMYKIAHEDPDLRLIPRGAKWDRLRAVLTRAFFKDAVRRYPTAAAMSADLALALQDLGGALDDTAASDKGMLRRTSYTAPVAARPADPSAPITSEGRPDPQPAAPPPPSGSPAAALPPRSSWPRPAVLGVALLVAVAAGMVVLLVWPRGGSGRPTPAPSLAPRGDGGSLVSRGARLSSPSLAPPSEAPPRPRPSPTAMAPASAPPRVVVSAPAPSATADPTRVAAGSSATAQLDRASDLYERGRYAAALAEAKAVLGREPGNREAKSLVEDIEADMAVAARLKQAQEAMRRGDREEALAQVRAGLAVKNNDGRLLSLFKELTQ
jgi:serine/threonine-protein kinase